MKVSRYAKSILAGALAAGYALQAALSDNVITNTEWVGVGTAALIAVGVLVVPNAPKGPTG